MNIYAAKGQASVIVYTEKECLECGRSKYEDEHRSSRWGVVHFQAHDLQTAEKKAWEMIEAKIEKEKGVYFREWIKKFPVKEVPVDLINRMNGAPELLPIPAMSAEELSKMKKRQLKRLMGG